ncbi:hypothetical protein QFZ67_007018 [Streptomyces sp. V1I1]|nr:hypothetical protein [Streptomyces sp. V1I1]
MGVDHCAAEVTEHRPGVIGTVGQVEVETRRGRCQRKQSDAHMPEPVHLRRPQADAKAAGDEPEQSVKVVGLVGDVRLEARGAAHGEGGVEGRRLVPA